MTWQDEDSRWDDNSRTCSQCGNKLRDREAASISGVCEACRHSHCECKPSGPLVAFVLWKGVRLGFDSREKARSFVENWKKANHPSVYSGSRENEPELEPVEEPVLVED